MTKGSPENPQGGAGKKPTKNDASKDKAAQTRKGANDEAPPQGKPARKVAKTMLEANIAQPKEKAPTDESAKAAKDKGQPAPAAPMSGMDRPARNRQVPRTMLENPVSSFDRFMQGEDTEGETVEEPLTTPAQTTPSAAPAAQTPAPAAEDKGETPGQKGRKAARTILENPVSTFDEYMQGDEQSTVQPVPEPITPEPIAPASAAAEMPSPQPPALVEPKAKGASGSKRVAKTIVEMPVANFEKYMPEAQSPSPTTPRQGAQAQAPAAPTPQQRPEPQASTAADIARIDSVEIPVRKEARPETYAPTPADIARIDSVETPINKGDKEKQLEAKSQSPKRTAKRTLMENEVPAFILERLSEEASANATTKKKTTSQRRVLKTLMEMDVADFESEVLSYVQPMEGLTTDAAPIQEPRKFVARTKLDLDVLAVAVAKHEKKMEEKAVAVAKAKALEPQKPFIQIENYKLAMTCAYRWEASEPKERYRACGKCNAWLYNFEGLELPEAEALVYKCQNIKNPPLYKRADGKFMTTDCPVEVKRKQDHMMLIVAAIFAVVAIAVVIMIIPKPPPQPPTPVSDGDDAPKKRKHQKIIPIKGKDGSVHFELKDLDEKSNSNSPSGGRSTSTSTDTSSSTSSPPAQPQTIQPIPMVPAPAPQQAPADQVWQYANPNDAQAPSK